MPGCWAHPGIEPQVNALSAKHAATIAASAERSAIFIQSMLLRTWAGASRGQLLEGLTDPDEPSRDGPGKSYGRPPGWVLFDASEAPKPV